MIQTSDALRVAVGPSQTYADLVRQVDAGSWRHTLAVPLFTALIIGACTSIAATGVASLPSIASGALCWSFVPVLQLVNGLLLCWRPPTPRVDRSKAIVLLFLAHLPWSIWLIAAALVFLWVPLTPAVVLALLWTTVVPLVWTAAILAAFCRSVLGCSARQATRRVLIHLASTLALMFLYAAVAVALWPRVLDAIS